MAELVEGARLEIVYTGNRIKGSNPFLSARKPPKLLGFGGFCCLLGGLRVVRCHCIFTTQPHAADAGANLKLNKSLFSLWTVCFGVT